MDRAEKALSRGKKGRTSEGAVERTRMEVLDRFGVSGKDQSEQKFADPVAFM